MLWGGAAETRGHAEEGGESMPQKVEAVGMPTPWLSIGAQAAQRKAHTAPPRMTACAHVPRHDSHQPPK